MHKMIVPKYLVVVLSLIGIGNVCASDLEKAIIAAEQRDPSFISAQANKDAAAENIAIARSRLLPQVSVQGAYSRVQQDISQINTAGQTSNRQQSVNSLNSSLSIRQGLYRPRDWIGYSIGELQSEFGIHKSIAAQSDLWLRVVSSWVDVLAGNENFKAQQQAVESTRYAAEQAAKRYKAGDGTKDARMEAAAQHELAKAQLIEVEETLKARKLTYRLLTGEEVNLNNKYFPKYQNIKLVFNLDNLIAKVMNANPEILSLKAAEQINLKRLEQASADHRPTVDLVSSFTKAESDTVNTLGSKYTTRSVGVQVVIPIFSGGGLDATERQQAAIYRAASADREATEIRIQNQIITDWASYKSGYDRITANQALVNGATEQKRAYQMGLKSGIKTWADVAQADISLARRQTDYINYSANLIKIQARLLSNLPTLDEDWARWINLLSVNSH